MRLGKKVVRRLLKPYLGESGTVGTQNLLTRELWLEQRLADIPAGWRILDAGAGELQYKRFCPHLDYVSFDFGQYDGAGDKSGLQIGSWDNFRLDIVSSIGNIPLRDASFDATMCIEVLEHVPYPVTALRELSRILKPGGILVVTAPFAALTHFAPYFYQSGYSRYFYEHWLTEFGLEIEDMQWNGNYFEYVAQELRRVRSIGRQYAGSSPTRLEFLAMEVTLGLLNRLSQRDSGSAELLAYGLHVQARKKL